MSKIPEDSTEFSMFFFSEKDSHVFQYHTLPAISQAVREAASHIADGNSRVVCLRVETWNLWGMKVGLEHLDYVFTWRFTLVVVSDISSICSS